MSDLELKWTYSVLWIILRGAQIWKTNKIWAVWDIAFRHPQAPYCLIILPWPHSCFSFSPHSFERSLTVHVAESDSACSCPPGGLLNKRRKHLYWEYKICPRRLTTGSEQLTWPRNINTQAFSVPRCVPNWHMKIGQLDPYHPYPILCFHKAERERGHMLLGCGQLLLWWWLRLSVWESVYELLLIEADTKLSQG